MPRRALFLDRDGTLIVDRKYLADPEGVTLLPMVREALLLAMNRGCMLFLFSNQSGVGRGYFTLADAEACNRRMLKLLDLPAPGFSEICLAVETPEAPPLYRKPSPRFILEMIRQHDLDQANTWMVGDKLDDVAAGINAGVNPVLVGHSAPSALPATALHCRDLF